MVIPGEQDFVDVVVKGFLVGPKQNHSGPPPVSNPKGNISGRFRSILLRKYRGTGQ
jgi:hypothetical protein